MKKLYYLIILTVILGLVLTGCSLLSNVGQTPTTGQSGIAYLAKGLPSGLVGLWHFDETSGTTATDSSGTNDGTLTNMNTPDCWDSGMFGNALSFDGSDDYVQVADNLSLDITTAITIEAWINPTTLGILGTLDRYRYIVSKRLENVANYGFRLNGERLEFYYKGLTGWQVWQSDLDVISLGLWQHVAVAFTFSSGSVALYVNGVPVNGSWTFGSGFEAVMANDYPLRIGALYEGKLLPFDGMIDEVRIWNIALLSEDIYKLPAISVEKSGPEAAVPGDTITYNYTVDNTGNCILYNVLLVDDKIPGPILLSSNELAPGASATGSADYTVLVSEDDPLENTATASAEDAFGNNVDDEAFCSVDVLHPDTMVTITPDVWETFPGGNVLLTITETNTGDVDLEEVQVVLNNGTMDIATLIAPPDSGDTENDGILGVGEIWTWVEQATIYVDTIFTVTGSGDVVGLGNIITYPDYKDEQDFVEVLFFGATRTLGFWKTHPDFMGDIFGEFLPINLGWKSVDDMPDMMSIFWANVAKNSDGSKRNKLCKARVQASWQAMAAILNSRMLGGAPLPNDVTLVSIASILNGYDVGPIKTLASQLDFYNMSGDEVALDPDLPSTGTADPNAARVLANINISFADCGN